MPDIIKPTNFPNGITSRGALVLTSTDLNLEDITLIGKTTFPGNTVIGSQGWIGINQDTPLSPLHIGALEGTPQSGIGIGRSTGWAALQDGHGMSVVDEFTTIGRAYAAYDDQGIMSGTGAFGHRVAYQARPIIRNIGDITRVTHFDSLLDTDPGSHVVSARLFYAQDDRATTAGTVDTLYQVYLDRFDPAKVNGSVFAFYQVGQDIPSRIDGNFGFGMNTPLAQVNIGSARSWTTWTSTSRQLAINATTLTDTDGTGAINQKVTGLSIGASSLASSLAQTITNAFSFYIAGPPGAGTNTTITNQWSAWFNAGKSFFGDGFNVGSATAVGGMATIGGNLSAASWTTVGKYLTIVGAGTLTDTSSAAAATVPQRAVNSLGITNVTSTNPITVTNAHTLYIGGAPIATGSTAITNAWAIYVASGKCLFGDAIQSAVVPIPAGGTTGIGYNLSSTPNFGVFFGSGVPSLSAAKGSLYLRSDGTGTSDRAYINTNGTTGWTNLTTAA